MKYQLTKQREPIAAGTYDECWKALLEQAGHQTLPEVVEAGYRIEPAGAQDEQAGAQDEQAE